MPLKSLKCTVNSHGGTYLQSMGGNSGPCCRDPSSTKALYIACFHGRNRAEARALPQLQLGRSYASARHKYDLAKASTL